MLSRSLLICAIGWAAYLFHSSLLFYTSWVSVWPLPISLNVALRIGIPVALAGLVIYGLAASGFRSWAWATGLEHPRLVRCGIYRFFRHPQYLGWTIVLFGIALIGRSALAFILVGVLAGVFAMIIPMEDRRLVSRFGDEYSQCRRQTPCIIWWRHRPVK